jgi:hypothetical protein
MSDEDRKALMMMVKDGALTTEQAMGMVSFLPNGKLKPANIFLILFGFPLPLSCFIPFLEYRIGENKNLIFMSVRSI